MSTNTIIHGGQRVEYIDYGPGLAAWDAQQVHDSKDRWGKPNERRPIWVEDYSIFASDCNVAIAIAADLKARGITPHFA